MSSHDRRGCPSRGTHGTAWSYDHYGCRCPDAVKAARARWRRSNTRRPRTGGRRVWPSSRTDPDVDPVLVARVCEGEPLRPTLAERLAAVARLTAAGRSCREIADLLHVHPRTVARYRQRSNTPTTPDRRAAA